MTVALRRYDPTSLSGRLRDAPAMTRPLMLELIDKACRRLPSLGQSERTARLTRLIDAEAWADAALALMELELPLWQIRRIAYDEGPVRQFRSSPGLDGAGEVRDGQKCQPHDTAFGSWRGRSKAILAHTF